MHPVAGSVLTVDPCHSGKLLTWQDVNVWPDTDTEDDFEERPSLAATLAEACLKFLSMCKEGDLELVFLATCTNLSKVVQDSSSGTALGSAGSCYLQADLAFWNPRLSFTSPLCFFCQRVFL